MAIGMQTLDEGDRLTRLEEAVRGLTGAVEKVARIQDQQQLTQTAIMSRLETVGKWDAKTVLTMAALTAAPIAAIWGLAVAPLQNSIVSLTHDRDAAREQTDVLDNKTVILQEKFAEVETQFRQVTEQRNIQHEALEGRVAELWAVEFSRPMSRTTQYPVTGNGRK